MSGADPDLPGATEILEGASGEHKLYLSNESGGAMSRDISVWDNPYQQ